MITLFSSLITLALAAQSAPTISTIASRMAEANHICGEAQLTVSMPQLPDDINYSVAFRQQQCAQTLDTLAPASYLIEWQADRSGQTVKGFSAYYPGHHFRFNGADKIQEYHLEDDATPFNPRNKPRGEGGVQRNAQFVDILPAFIAERMANDAMQSRNRFTIHTDTMVDDKKSLVVDLVSLLPGGAIGKESEYVIDPDTSLPLRITHENNPGSISEQTLTVRYDWPSISDCTDAINEQLLIGRWPEEFASFRRSNFRIGQMVGQQLPAFSLPTPTGERYTRPTASEPLRAPTIMALLESGQTFNPQLVAALREAAAQLPFAADIIFAYTDAHTATIEEETGQLLEGEHLLMSARGLARDCGAAMMPTLLLIDRQGRVGEIIVGFNNDLASDVIQKLTLIN